ncbi:PREDICTED: fibroblast growth factor-binding protein 3 [Elephantulus edwardii]|uniref:fibroblast growth factor-binding protein 3 n=1 Tax=Elephantulus edwardii TaxID=28737 RepID=UPI0003F08FFC|nr:PREDICTED: fibroblast growth factor-binding protein 3 [Elephantulus edwardii]
MTHPRVQASLSLLILGSCLLAAARRNQGAASRAAPVARDSAGASSGRFVSPERQACSWQLREPGPGAARGGELALSCQAPDGARSQCVHRWEAASCAAYAAREAHYWKALLGRLRKKRLPCHDPARLQARLCAARKAHGASLRPAPRAPPRPIPSTQEPKPRARVRGRPREPVPGPNAEASPPTSTASKEHPAEKKTKGAKKKGVWGPEKELPLGTRSDLDRLDENSELTETYCAEKWHSLCNFFVNFWNG